MNELAMRLYGKKNKTNRQQSLTIAKTNKISVRPLVMMLFNKTDKTDKTDKTNIND